MDEYKFLKTSYLNKELKNLPKPPSKDILSNLNKNTLLAKLKESQKNTQKKTNPKKNIFSPSKKNQNQNPTKSIKGNVIKETIIFNAPNKSKGRSLEKVPSSKNIQNKNNLYYNYLDFNLNKKKSGNKNIFPNEKNKEKRNFVKKEKNNDDNRKKNNLYNYNIINNNNEINDESETKFNSVCVSINNNYNYNLSLGNENPNNSNNIKERTETWQEKFNRVNKQKENMNNLDYKQLTESDFFKNKIAKKEKEEKEEKNNILNKSENNQNFKQKIRELNAGAPPNPFEAKFNIEQKNNININENLNINNEINNAPKKRTGILGLLQAFKDFLPNNLRKKNSIKNTTEQNNNINNKINVNVKVKEKQIINIPNTPKISNTNYNSVNTTPKITIYERKNKFINNDEYGGYNNNHYNNDNDDAYDSCPVQNNNNSYTYHHKNMNRLNDNDHQILSYSQKDIFRYNNNTNNNNIYIKGRTDLNNKQYDKNNEYYKNKTEVEQKETGLFNFFGFGKNKYNKIVENNNNNYNNNNNLIQNFYNEEKIIPFQNPNYSTTYIKKQKINSPLDDNNNTYDKDSRKISFNQIGSNPNNNIFANYLNDLNTPKENRNKPMIKQRLLEKFNDDYNDENIEENLNINAEKKIQEIKINIRQKKEYGNNNNYNKINNSAIYTNKKAYNTLDDLILNPKPQNKIETCVINFSKNSNNSNNKIYNTPKPNYNKNLFEENLNINKYQNSYTSNKNEIYSKPYDLSQSQRNLNHNLNINQLQNKYNTDMDNQSVNSAYTAKPMKKKLAINKSERQFKINKTSNNTYQDSGDTDSESNSDFSEISQTSTKTAKPTNAVYFKHFKSFFNKNKEGNSITNNFFKKIFKRDNKKYDTDNSFNSEKSDFSNLAINNITPLPSEENYYKKNLPKEIKRKINNNKLHFMKKIYNYNLHTPKNIKKGYYVTKQKIQIMKLPLKKASIYTKDYYKIKQKPKIKINYIDKKRIKIKQGINLPLCNTNFYFTKKNMIIYINENIENDINNENININEEIKNKNKNYFSPTSPKKKDKEKNIYKENSLTYSPQFGTKKESPVLNPSRSARDINKIISIEIDLKDNKTPIQQNTPNRNLGPKINTSDNLYIKKKPNMMRIINTDDKCKTYFKNNKKLYDSYNMKNINDFNIDTEIKEPIKKKSKIISIDIDLKNERNNFILNKINNIKINDVNELSNKIQTILEEISPKKNNMRMIVNNLFILITKKNNQMRLSFMEILSNENAFVKIIINKSLENNDQQKIIFFAQICQQLCFKLNEEINLNSQNANQIDEDLTTILAEECKLKFENILINNNNINDNGLFGIIIFVSELIELNMVSIHLGFYFYEMLYKKFKISNLNKYYYLDMIIILLNKIGKFSVKEKYFYEINNFIDNELNNLVNRDSNLPLFMKNKIFELAKIKKYQWMIHNK